MTADVILSIIIGIIVIKYFVDVSLNKLTQKSLFFSIPESLKDIYDEGVIKKQRNYKIEHLKLDNLENFLNFILLFFALSFGLLGKLDNLIRNILQNFYYNEYLVTITYFIIIGLILKLLSLPFDYYSVFKIEKKYGFSNYTKNLFIKDIIKEVLLAIIIGVPLIIIILKIYFSLNDWFVPATLIVLLGFTIFIHYFYTTLILPVFNKLSPLPEAELKEKIKNYCLQSGFKIKDVYIIDESKRTTKGNAFFTGFGKNKKIILYDTLLKDFTQEEIISILLHEIGHYKHKHIIKLIILTAIQLTIILGLLWIFLKYKVFSEALGANQPSFHIGIIAFGILYSPISFIKSILINNISRKFEFQADNYVKNFNLNNELIQSLKKLARKNYSHLTPHPVIVKILYSHPPLKDRIENLMNNK